MLVLTAGKQSSLHDGMYTRTHRIEAKCNGSLELSNDSSGITNSFSLYCTLYYRAIAIGQRHHYSRVSLWFTYLHIVLAYSFLNVFVPMCGVVVLSVAQNEQWTMIYELLRCKRQTKYFCICSNLYQVFLSKIRSYDVVKCLFNNTNNFIFRFVCVNAITLAVVIRYTLYVQQVFDPFRENVHVSPGFVTVINKLTLLRF